jgi:uncharacterized damage-inducible protein DinB
MDLLEHLRRMLEHDGWANRETVISLQAVRVPPVKALRILAHVAAGERLWLVRVRGGTEKVPVWPELSLDDCATRLEEMPPAWRDFLDSLAPVDLSGRVDYRNTQGEAWSSTRRDILTHVALHSSYHRGQIASALRNEGEPAAYTDYIHCTRMGLIG